MGSHFSEGEIQRTSILWGKISTSLGSVKADLVLIRIVITKM